MIADSVRQMDRRTTRRLADRAIQCEQVTAAYGYSLATDGADYRLVVKSGSRYWELFTVQEAEELLRRLAKE